MRDVKIPNWLSGLPLAPEFHPTDTEFADPIAYISKIEKEASAFGICKVIPPLPKPTKKFVISNLNKSLSKCPELGSDVNLDNFKGKRINGGEVKAVFTTRQQELGQNGKRTKGVQKQSQPIHKQVWQSGEVYTLEQFESKAKIFARSQLGLIKQVSALVIEALFWKAASEKPIYVEYANDVPGSGFGEPNGSAQYCRNTSMRTQNKNKEEGSEIKKELRGTVTESGCVTNNYNPSTMINTSSNISSARSSRENRGNDMECTSGQKLSNSPWNLQVIAQSSGSLTRFMADNIPGVTSPMVYIGMLFSWFAWHVEDHELHSLNYLHTGSQKTWYAVPADYASTFEEVIRNQAYGGDIDRLAALTLLGEKTTLLSPEVIVASGIPCCRLVQNPGEFVITFPRAYHVGFSHGFNCGEAANFGTPQWLTLAKEAAVRRAAMNHLPMLSHQQLLYLSTMSFISRVPRSLMPGVRCSRLRDRQKEERELLVKKAFVEDIIGENNKLTSLLQKKSSYRAVLWDMEMLQPSPKESDLVNNTIDMTSPKEVILSETDHKLELSNQNLFMEYMDDAYLSSEFQTDSGALACVACGLLGFPFMSVVQPSKEGFVGILSTQFVESSSSLFLDCMVDVSVSDAMKRHDITGGEINLTKYCVQPSRNTRSYSDTEDEVIKDSSKLVLKPAGAYSFLKDLPRSSLYDLNDSPNTYLRPRIFCLEHAIQVEELLCGKGGADVLVICHSDFKKIKLHAAAVAEEIGSPFSYKELLLDNASPEDLTLINFAIDDEGQDQCREDWTSSVKINLRHCLKVFQKFPSEGLQHALTLRGLSFDKLPSESYECFKWKSTKSRSKRRKLNQSGTKSSESTLITKDETIGSISNVPLARSKQVKLLHYVRRFKSKNSGSVRASQICEVTQKMPLPVACVNLDKNGHEKIGDEFSINENTGAHSDPSPLDSPEPSHLQKENKCILETRDISEISVLPLVKSDLLSAKPLTQDATLEIGDNISKESNMKDKECGSTAFNIQIQQGIKLAAGNISKKNGKCVETSAKSPEFSGLTAACQATKNVEVERDNQMTEELCSHDVNCDLAIVGDNVGLHDIQEYRDASSEDVSYPTISNDSATDITKVESLCEQQIEKPLAEVNIGDDGCPNLECVVQPLCAASLVNRTQSNKSCPASIEESRDVPTKSSAVEKMDGNEEISMQDMRESQINKSTNGSREDSAAALANHAPLNKSYATSVEEIGDVPSKSSAAEKMDSNKEITSVRDMPELDRNNSKAQPSSTVKKIRKRKREADLLAEDGSVFDGFIRSPCEGLRPRASNTVLEDKPVTKKTSDSQKQLSRSKKKTDNKKASYKCDVEGCKLSFKTKEELRLHKRNQCPHEGCGKKFNSHKNAVLHFRVHDDDRPLKCPWEGCTKSFKWAWARTEHIRVHTGEKPYKCKVKGCGLAFRFVSDYSRHRRKTGHYVT